MAHSDSFLVHQASSEVGPATHAIVIGVGDYPHLADGSATLTQDHEGLGQLTSPPISARDFAHWLIASFSHPDKPLASVALLVSERRPQPFVNLRTNKSYALAVANSANVMSALNGWKGRGNESENNLLLFFFCGHGLSEGPITSLLLADYGAQDMNALNGALAFNSFRSGMERCRASEQCYFVDACRTHSDMLVNASWAVPGTTRPS